MPHPRLFDAMTSQPWAILPEAFEQMVSILSGQRDWAALSQALQKKQGAKTELNQLKKELLDPETVQNPLALSTSIQNEYRTQLGSVAVLELDGPIYPKANLVIETSGGISLATLEGELKAALSDKKVNSIVIRINSPGGVAYGIGDFYRTLREANKPVYAYAQGTCASAAYWIACGCDTLYTSSGALLGSIGALVSYTDQSRAREAQGLDDYTVVSSQSPLKTATPADKKGQAAYQRLVDRLAAQFIGDVAQSRGVTPEDVAKNFAQGFVVDGIEAQQKNMADQVITFNQLIQQLNQPGSPGGLSESAMSNTQVHTHPGGAPTVVATEVKNIDSQGEAQTQLVASLAKNTEILAKLESRLGEVELSNKNLIEENGHLKTELENLKTQDQPGQDPVSVHGAEPKTWSLI